MLHDKSINFQSWIGDGDNARARTEETQITERRQETREK